MRIVIIRHGETVMELYEKGIFLVEGKLSETADNSIGEGKKKTMAAKIIAAHARITLVRTVCNFATVKS